MEPSENLESKISTLAGRPGSKNGGPSGDWPFLRFVYLLREEGILVGLKEVLELYRGLEKGLASNLDGLFLFARLVFVKRVEHLDVFECAFCLYFYGVDLPRVVEGDPELFRTKQFREWLEQEMRAGRISRNALWRLAREELMKMFWDRVREQMEAHHGGNKWIGTGGTSPLGHSGFSQRGVRVFGGSRNRSAIKVIGDRRYVSYDAANTLKGDNIRQVLASLRNMLPAGPESELDLVETIRKTAKNGGEIDLIFKRQKLDRIKLLLFLDNGGSSMLPFVALTRLLFSKIRDRFKECGTFYFHNAIYDRVYRDPQRMQPVAMEEILRYQPQTRVFFVGDASMAPEELVDPYGSIHFGSEDRVSGIERLKSLGKRFKYSVWLNPIAKEEWPHTHGYWTVSKIREVIHMEDLSLRGIRAAVEYLRNLEPAGSP